MNEFYAAVARDMGMDCDDVFVNAIEAACVTRVEYSQDPQSCHSRINGALEEMYDFETGAWH